MYHLRRLFTCLLVLLIVFLPLGSSSQNANALSLAPLSQIDPSLRDAEIYAQHFGVSLEEALHRFHLQDVAGDLNAELSRNEVETFAGLWVEHSPYFRIVVEFTQDPDQKVKPYVTNELADVLVVRTAKIPLASLRSNQIDIISSLKNLKIPVETEIDVYENNIKLYVAQADVMRFNASKNGLLRMLDHTYVITIPKLGEVEGNIYGGLALSQCTTGFSVQNSQGKRGITTAGHCVDELSYNGISLDQENEIYNSAYDVQWHTSPWVTVTNEFKAGPNDIRRVTGTRGRDGLAVGLYVCKYGVVTHYTCGTVSSIYATANVPSTTATYIRVDNNAGYYDLSSSGDSGGPWFNSNIAYGIHQGHPGSDANDALYMAINYIDGLGLNVVLWPRFQDVPWDYWAWQDIERFYNSGITAGCSTNPPSYCPDHPLTRAQMAIFLLRGIHGATYTPPPVGSSTGFDDVPVLHWAAAWIKQFHAEGITAGCSLNPPLYCPEDYTTHAQMAVFLLKSKYGTSYSPPPVGTSTGFYDVPTTHWAAPWIKQLRVEGISSGCGGGYFCPESNVTRAEMAGLFVRTFNLP